MNGCVAGGTRGAGTRRSISQKAVSRTAESVDPTTVWVEVQPWVPAFSMA